MWPRTAHRPDKLAVLARALQVRSTGPKARVAAGVVARADLLERMLRLGDDPQALDNPATSNEPRRPPLDEAEAGVRRWDRPAIGQPSYYSTLVSYANV